VDNGHVLAVVGLAVMMLYAGISGVLLLVSPRALERWLHFLNPSGRGRDPWGGQGDPIFFRFFAVLLLIAAFMMARVLFGVISRWPEG
jgi:hypothetical protein